MLTSISKHKFIHGLINELQSLPHRDEAALDELLKRSEMYIRNIFGESSKYLTDLKKIDFHPRIFPADEEYYNERWQSGTYKLRNLYNTMLEEFLLFGELNISPDQKQEKKSPTKTSKKGFVVHGHNEGIKNESARFLEKLGLEAIILHERPNNGRTIIEKFEHESSEASFALILLTADDQGSKLGSAEGLNPRARQNVIFEFGYFIGKMGRSKVIALVEEGVEIPSDYSGVIFIPFDDVGAWKLTLAKELKTTGIDIDMNLAI